MLLYTNCTYVMKETKFATCDSCNLFVRAETINNINSIECQTIN